MRHTKHRFKLGVKKEHREALIANLASQLFTHGRIKTTLVKAKALRPFAEKIITLAKKAAQSEAPEQKLHFRRLAVARVRNEVAVKKLFDETVQQFLDRSGGYTRIYKLFPRVGDASKQGIIEFVSDSTAKRKKKKTPSNRKNKPSTEDAKEAISEGVLEAQAVENLPENQSVDNDAQAKSKNEAEMAKQ